MKCYYSGLLFNNTDPSGWPETENLTLDNSVPFSEYGMFLTEYCKVYNFSIWRQK